LKPPGTPQSGAGEETRQASVSSGAVMLSDIAGGITMLKVACSQCERRGRLRVARLIAQHGADMGLPELRSIIHERCGVHDPQLGAAAPDASMIEPAYPKRTGWNPCRPLCTCLG
jgi:hypothetical protein